MKKGFTLVEILVAVMIITMLVAMSVPMYEKTVEKSRMAEVRALLKQIMESKMRILDAMDRDTYSSGLFGFEALDVAIPCVNATSGALLSRCEGDTIYTKDFKYSLSPTGASANAVCAERRSGDNMGVQFLYLGEEASGTDEKFLCNNGASGGSCELYGLESTGTRWCS